MAKKTRDIFDRRQIQIAKKTLRMPDAMANISGQSKEEAREILEKFGYTKKEIERLEK